MIGTMPSAAAKTTTPSFDDGFDGMSNALLFLAQAFRIKYGIVGRF